MNRKKGAKRIANDGTHRFVSEIDSHDVPMDSCYVCGGNETNAVHLTRTVAALTEVDQGIHRMWREWGE